MLRHLGFVVATLALLAVAPAGRAATGINVYGLSWHTTADHLRGFNPGLGVREQFLRTPGWKADVVAGGYRDSIGDLMLHAAVGAQFHVVSDLYVGAHLMAGCQGDALDKIILAPLPSASFEAGPVDLNVHYIPRVKGITGDTASYAFHVTCWPFGGRRPLTTGPHDPDGRFALEFGVVSGPRFTELDGRTVSARWTTNPRHAWRAGFDLAASHDSYEYSSIDHGIPRAGRSAGDDVECELLLQHLWLYPSKQGTRLLVGFGPDLRYRKLGVQSWSPGLALGLGAEADLIRGLSVLAEYTTTVSWLIQEYDPDIHTTQTSVRAQARLGVTLWW